MKNLPSRILVLFWALAIISCESDFSNADLIVYNANKWTGNITAEQALIAYTRNAAYASFDEDINGSLEIGKLADFVVLDQDLTKVDPSEIKNIRVL